uniref:Uncharacterized protein n=1 Tax=Spongospora subterranea TaxID=70186 RepID=A0A0H5RCW2_9EUKA|eukprot:CRZ11442.1 hypothetical protein [Spongospora subterranea]
MDSLRSSLWSMIGLNMTASTDALLSDADTPANLVSNMHAAKSLSASLDVAVRNLTTYLGKLQEFSTSSCLVANDLAQLCTFHEKLNNIDHQRDLIAKAADLQQNAEKPLNFELNENVIAPMKKWKVLIDALIVKLEEQRRMHQQAKCLRSHIRLLEDNRVRQVRNGRWHARDEADLQKAQNALVAWEAKCEAMDMMMNEAVEKDLVHGRHSAGLPILKAFNHVEECFWTAGSEMCTIRRALIGDILARSSQVTDPSIIKKKKKKSKQTKKVETLTKDNAMKEGRIVEDHSTPDILTSFDWYKYEPDPFATDDGPTGKSEPSNFSHSLNPGGKMKHSSNEGQADVRSTSEDPFLSLGPFNRE